jgi:predicted alpha-1,6-mannanase (GH76 family)
MIWGTRAEAGQQALEEYMWNAEIRMFNIETPCPDGSCNTIFHYWWMAHAVDAMVDGYARTSDARYAERLSELYEGIKQKNGGSFPNPLYDDMEWMALAWLRAYQVTGEDIYKDAAITLWEDIQTGWNDHMGGGIAWQKSQLDYKNTPANAPAVILAARLYREFGKVEDLAWAKRIYTWLKASLVDPDTGFVWDGMNREGDGEIDKGWKFTYCQGVYIGAGVELYKCTDDRTYLEDAIRTADRARIELGDPATGLLPEEGDGDGGLFKGILVRYLAELVKAAPAERNVAEWLVGNGSLLWAAGRSEAALFGTSWAAAPAARVTLSTQLSGVLLLEALAGLAAGGLLEVAGGANANA